MSELSKKVSYIRGLADGLELNKESNEGKIIAQLLELVGEMADEIEALQDDLAETDELVDEMSGDLLDLLREVYDDEDEENDDYDDLIDDDDYDYEDQDDLYEIECPHCHEDVMIEFDMIDEDNAIICPNCHEEIPLEFDFDDDYEE